MNWPKYPGGYDPGPHSELPDGCTYAEIDGQDEHEPDYDEGDKG